MKIYDKKSFVIGILILCVVPILTFGITEGKAALYVLAIGFAGKYLYTGLSEHGNVQQKYMDGNYKRVSEELLGKHATMKRWLPLILLGVFLVVSQVLIEAFDYWESVSAGAVLMVLIISAIIIAYSIGVEMKIIKQVTAETENQKNESKQTNL